MDTEIESNPTPAKRPRISIEESAVGQHPLGEMEARSNNRRMCNELIHELCLKIPTTKTSDSILLTAHNMYAYLAPQFSKKLIYRDAITFLKAMMKAEKEDIQIQIDQMAQNKESEPIVAIRQEQSDEEFHLETNKFRIWIWNEYQNLYAMLISANYEQFECPHLLYFLHLIAPLLQPIQLYMSYDLSHIPIARLIRFMNKHSDWIDSIALRDYYFYWEPIYGALRKFNKVQIYGPISPDNVPKLVHWLTTDNGQPKKYLFLGEYGIDDGLALLIEELKKEFALATGKCRFVVRVNMRQPLNEFTLCNELTGEKLELRRKHSEDGWYFHALSRSPDNGLEDNENDYAELDTLTQIYLR